MGKADSGQIQPQLALQGITIVTAFLQNAIDTHRWTTGSIKLRVGVSYMYTCMRKETMRLSTLANW